MEHATALHAEGCGGALSSATCHQLGSGLTSEPLSSLSGQILHQDLEPDQHLLRHQSSLVLKLREEEFKWPSSTGVQHSAGSRAVHVVGLMHLVARRPVTGMVPLMVLVFLIVAGEMAVWGVARRYRDDRHMVTYTTATTTAQQIELLLQGWSTPAISLGLLVKQTPYVPDLVQLLPRAMNTILNKMDVVNVSIRLTIYPSFINTCSAPINKRNQAQINTNILELNMYKNSFQQFSNTPPDNADIWGPVVLLDYGMGFVARFNIWLPSSNPNETWGMDQPFTSACAPGTTLGNISRSSILSRRPDSNRQLPDDLGSSLPVNLTWTLCLHPVSGYDPSWATPLYIVIPFVALFISGLMFSLMTSQERHRVLVEAILPRKVIKRLGRGDVYMEDFKAVTALFSDIVSYTTMSSELPPKDLVKILDELYSGFDALVDKHGLHKVETIGDAFFCVGGAPTPCNPLDAARRVARMALDMIDFVEDFQVAGKDKIRIRVGIYTGDVTAAVMGSKVPHWALVGDTINVTSRMESNSRPQSINVGPTTAALLSSCPEFALEPRGEIDIKGKGRMHCYWLRATPCSPRGRTVPRAGRCRFQEGKTKTLEVMV